MNESIVDIILNHELMCSDEINLSDQVEVGGGGGGWRRGG